MCKMVIVPVVWRNGHGELRVRSSVGGDESSFLSPLADSHCLFFLTILELLVAVEEDGVRSLSHWWVVVAWFCMVVTP